MWSSNLTRYGLLLIVLLLIGMSGCARLKTRLRVDYRTISLNSSIDTVAAKAKYNEAVKLLRLCRGCEAEQLLQKALIADETYGPAHNALGKVYFDCDKHYFAAREFDRAVELMPGRGEPLNNLGLVYESVGQLDRAIEYFEQASMTDQENAQYLGNLIRSRIRRGDKTSDLRAMLEQLVFLDNRQEWVDWARKELAFDKIDRPYTTSSDVLINDNGPIQESYPYYGDAAPSLVESHSSDSYEIQEVAPNIEALPYEPNSPVDDLLDEFEE